MKMTMGRSLAIIDCILGSLFISVSITSPNSGRFIVMAILGPLICPVIKWNTHIYREIAILPELLGPISSFKL